MAQTLNAASPTYTSGLLTGPTTIIITQASRFKCGVLKVLIALDNASPDNFAYTGLVFNNSDSVTINVLGEYYLRFEFSSCTDGAVAYLDLIQAV